MSSCPGLQLEDFIMWKHDLIVDGYTGANSSLQIAETLGVQTRRVRITRDQFIPFVELYEPYRDHVEQLLLDFDEYENSWRDYAGYNFDFIPDTICEQAEFYFKKLF